MSTPFSRLLGTIVAFALVLSATLPVAPAGAITYGQPDGDRHPYVGALIAPYQGKLVQQCTGTLISPTVFLTDAHCDIGTEPFYVTFDPVFTPQSTLYEGTFHGDPLFRPTTRNGHPHDIAVVVFEEAIPGFTQEDLPRLPAVGLLDTIGKDQQFTAVGYGFQERVRQPGEPGGPVFGDDNTRRYAVSTLTAAGKEFLHLSQNPVHGDSGTCWGDSGGPNFLGAGASETNIIAALTNTGDFACRSTNVVLRLDTEAVHQFLGQFVDLP